jgi:hypothetical protein
MKTYSKYFWEEVIDSFPLILHGPHRKRKAMMHTYPGILTSPKKYFVQYLKIKYFFFSNMSSKLVRRQINTHQFKGFLNHAHDKQVYL